MSSISCHHISVVINSKICIVMNSKVRVLILALTPMTICAQLIANFLNVAEECFIRCLGVWIGFNDSVGEKWVPLCDSMDLECTNKNFQDLNPMLIKKICHQHMTKTRTR